MKSVKLTRDDINVSLWGGGTTSEILIFPDSAKYSDRNFLFRISSATVDEEVSAFTRLYGYSRLIVSLDHSFSLSHDGAAEILIPPYTVHEFDGASETVSRGRITDFNLMLRKERAFGQMNVFTSDASVSDDGGYLVRIVYAPRGKVGVKLCGARYALGTGEALVIKTDCGEPFSAELTIDGGFVASYAAAGIKAE